MHGIFIVIMDCFSKNMIRSIVDLLLCHVEWFVSLPIHGWILTCFPAVLSSDIKQTSSPNPSDVVSPHILYIARYRLLGDSE